jgi:hypothetical protein
MAKPKPDLRPLHRAAYAGDHSAARAVLKLYGFGELAAEIKPGKPFSTRVRNAVGAISGSVDTEWEKDLLHDPPPRRSKATDVTLFDD